MHRNISRGVSIFDDHWILDERKTVDTHFWSRLSEATWRSRFTDVTFLSRISFYPWLSGWTWKKFDGIRSINWIYIRINEVYLVVHRGQEHQPHLRKQRRRKKKTNSIQNSIALTFKCLLNVSFVSSQFERTSSWSKYESLDWLHRIVLTYWSRRSRRATFSRLSLNESNAKRIQL